MCDTWCEDGMKEKQMKQNDRKEKKEENVCYLLISSFSSSYTKISI